MKYYKYDFNNRYYYLRVTSKDKVEVLGEYNIDTYLKAIDSFKKNMDKAELISLKTFNFELKKYTMMRELQK